MNIINLIKQAAFKAMILLKARYCKGNIKTGYKVLTWSKLKGNKEYFIKDLKCCVCGSCGKYCSGCDKGCYVTKSYRYSSVIKSHAIRTIAIRYFLDDLKECLIKQLQRMRKKPDYVRIHQSGEFETLQEFLMHIDIARQFPDITFYAYTKAYDIIVPYILQHADTMPDNFIILISIWNECGIKEYNLLKHLPFIKAFVCLTGYDYAAAGIDITTVCNAYDSKGKLNHELTCDKCKKCMLCNDNNKCIGCVEH